MEDLILYERELRKKFNADVERDIDKIVSHIRDIKGKLRIAVRILGYDELLELSESEEQAFESYELTEDGVVFLLYSEDILNLIKRYIDSDISELEMPVKSLCDSDFLNRMNNLKVINVGENDFIDDASLKTIVENSNVSEIKSVRRPALVALEDIIYVKDYFRTISAKYKDTIIRSSDNYDCDRLNLVIDDVQNIEKAWDFFLDEYGDIKDLELIIVNHSEEPLFDKNIVSLSYKGGKVCKADVNIEDISRALDALLMFEEYFDEDTNVMFHVKNQTYPEFDKVSEVLRKYNSEIYYPSNYVAWDCECVTDIDGFEYMRGAIDYYKGLIQEYDLSPYEQLVYAYDLIKSFSYLECEENKNLPREIPDIIRSGYIVCVGYSVFLSQLLSELGFDVSTVGNIKVIDNGEDFGHVRNVIYLNDDKYGIDGVYSFDATYDSQSDDFSLVLDEVGEKIKKHPKGNETIMKKYSPTASFSNFLIPYSEYSILYGTELDNVYELMPNFMNDANDVCINKILGKHYDSSQYASKLHNSPVIPNDKLRKALEVVKRCQGFTDEEANRLIDEAIEMREITHECKRKRNKMSSVNEDDKQY